MYIYANFYILIEPTPLLKPISNGKSKTFLNKPDDTSSDEDDHEPSTLTEE